MRILHILIGFTVIVLIATLIIMLNVFTYDKYMEGVTPTTFILLLVTIIVDLLIVDIIEEWRLEWK